MIDNATGYECWLIDDNGGRIAEFQSESVVETSPPVSTRVKAVSTSRLSRSAESVASTCTSALPPPYTPFSSPIQEPPSQLFDTPSLRIVRCYVQVVPRAHFAVHFQETDTSPPHALAVEVLVDGRFVRGRFVRRGASRVDFNICRRTGEGSPITSPLEFSDFREIEDTLAVAGDELGTICVDVWKGRSRSMGGTLANIMTTADAEDVLTPRPVRCLPPVFLRGGTAFDPLMNFEFEDRLVRFEFQYRTEAFLRVLRLKSKPKSLRSSEHKSSSGTPGVKNRLAKTLTSTDELRQV
eukprot:Gregarina_sp_Pseudo_9__1127@NODE_1737_length_1361_cov_16_457640_g1611_i0_p1_GENE_NODE_1737_length_1361_cov_16_457640_g1611_i0NODE_1737_length_1361_cov_16_457640_g1611_i0_p1_ORF_typecomplete_len321_score48_89_NODE_1737_length_1361_cov_16_457640_g1611_i03981285